MNEEQEMAFATMANDIDDLSDDVDRLKKRLRVQGEQLAQLQTLMVLLLEGGTLTVERNGNSVTVTAQKKKATRLSLCDIGVS